VKRCGPCWAQVARAGLTVPAVLAARACVGLGEGVALPTMNHLVAAHVPPGRRATALGTAFTGFHCGARIAVPI
jgi:ACS family sodium-dependent inorganic phosphate cotransporter